MIRGILTFGARSKEGLSVSTNEKTGLFSSDQSRAWKLAFLSELGVWCKDMEIRSSIVGRSIEQKHMCVYVYSNVIWVICIIDFFLVWVNKFVYPVTMIPVFGLDLDHPQHHVNHYNIVITLLRPKLHLVMIIMLWRLPACSRNQN